MFRYLVSLVCFLAFLVACGGGATPVPEPAAVVESSPSGIASEQEQPAAVLQDEPSDAVVEVEGLTPEVVALVEGAGPEPGSEVLPVSPEAPSVGLPEVTVEEVLERLAEAGAVYNSGAYHLSVYSVDGSDGIEIGFNLDIAGEYQGFDRQRLKVKLDAVFFSVETEMVIIDDEVYVKDPGTGHWSLEEGEVSFTGDFHEMVETLSVVNAGAPLGLSGIVAGEDQEFYVLEGEVPPEAFSAVLGEGAEGIESLLMSTVLVSTTAFCTAWRWSWRMLTAGGRRRNCVSLTMARSLR